ncbi:hypothetical protein E4T56_gene16495 [Termitomyces sp. T112]|nr:hypothetical protein E4T56_gene16495 [Termitomyces sp. T112]
MPALTFQENWGVQLIAYMFNAVTYGMGTLLVMQYFRSHSKNDSVPTRLAVALLFIFATVQLVFLSHQIYIDFVTWFAIPNNLDIITFSASAQLLAIYLTAFTAQQFFASRIWMFSPPSKRIFFVSPVILLSFLQLGFGITQTILVIRVGTFSHLETTVKYTSTQAGCTAACDIVITTMLCWLLNKSRSGLKKTDSVVDKLILYAINRGAATSLAALMNLILFVSVPNTFIFMIFLLPSCQLYVLSVVSMLTSRESLRQQLWKGTATDHSSIPMENFRARVPADIRIEKSVVSWKDGQENDQNMRKPSFIPQV